MCHTCFAALVILAIGDVAAAEESVQLSVERRIITVVDETELRRIEDLYRRSRFGVDSAACERILRIAESSTKSKATSTWSSSVPIDNAISVAERAVIGITKVEGTVHAIRDTYDVDLIAHLYDKRKVDGGAHNSFYGIQTKLKKAETRCFVGELASDEGSCTITFYIVSLSEPK
jgi:hypothetical protein